MIKSLSVIVALALIGAASPALAATAKPAAPVWSVTDQLQIQDLMARYEWALDSADAKAYAALFAEDGVLVGGPSEQKGRAAIQKAIEDLNHSFAATFPTGVPPRIQHILSNLVVEQHGDTADAKSYWTEIWNPTGKGMAVRVAGHYEDKLVRRGGKWQFARRQIFDDFPK
jgi:uncharacterized protein (TIGR02246 family)